MILYNRTDLLEGNTNRLIRAVSACCRAIDICHEPAKSKNSSAGFVSKALNLFAKAHIAGGLNLKIFYYRLRIEVDISCTHWVDCLNFIRCNHHYLVFLSVSDEPWSLLHPLNLCTDMSILSWAT